ncbi:endonuclease/exonuclease/phosphatase family protein [Haloarcula onubensis]|uniref:Endonuclease/exonuclease/phosphatase family protein n=1 Tax=Haloarcula onubensis TaxID=2950539 RepID=A0ABU2FKS1_9EURY|nr:endonuclease/exonuclease/phosphatase family protein [Halomicroarcula sp. S3CR25-11]MDS0280852.1 endonuclease/exonuclease/phosphatase family protein [Halomicroarcula sp. S3CR25-11]
MRSPDTKQSPVTRRALLASTAGVAAGVVGTTGTAAAQSPTATVMTQNAYLGFDVAELLRAESLAEVRSITGGFLDGIEPALYAARADSIAAAVENSDADVVALQEAVLLRRQQPGDYATDSSAAAADVVVDLLDRVRTALTERGLDYAVAAESVANDFELPAETDDGPVDLRITDRDVLLVRSDLDTGEPVTATYDASLELPIPESDRTLPITRGYGAVDVTVGGVDLRAVSTHLESAAPQFRRRQARELLDALPAGRPVVVCGDLNSAPGEAAHDVLTRSLTDPYAELRPDANGATCCQAKDLRNEESLLDRRIDTLLYRGPVTPTAIRRVGYQPSDRTPVEVGGETVRVWPSDHAGVVGTFDLSGSGPSPATASRTAPGTATTRPGTPSAGPPSSPSTATGASGSGFTAGSAILGVLAGAGAWLHRRTQ